MKTSSSFGLGLLSACVSLALLACGSDSKDGAAGDGGADPTDDSGSGGGDPGSGGGPATGGRSGSGGGSATGGGSGDGGSDPGDSGAGGSQQGAGGSQQGAGGSQQGAGGSQQGAGGGGGPVTDGWFCMQVGEACSCIPATGVAPQNTCTQPVQPCCFTFDGNCQCQPTTQISCPQWISAIAGTAVSTCPPP